MLWIRPAILFKVPFTSRRSGGVFANGYDVLDLAHFRSPIPAEIRASIVDDRSHRAQNSRGQEIDTRIGLTGECDLDRQSVCHEHAESVSLADLDVGELPRNGCGSVSGFSLGDRQAADLVVTQDTAPVLEAFGISADVASDPETDSGVAARPLRRLVDSLSFKDYGDSRLGMPNLSLICAWHGIKPPSVPISVDLEPASSST
jgi:hypothetical protein